MFKGKNLFIIILLTMVFITGNIIHAEAAETITIEHALGEAVVNINPENVIVFDYGTLDSLDQMGIDIKGLPKSNIPTYLEEYNDDKYVDVGTLFEPNFERIFSLQPDLILISDRQIEVYDELSRIAPTVYLTVDGADYMGSVRKNTRILGEIFDEMDFVEKRLEKISQEVDNLGEKVTASGNNALVIMANDGSMSAYGPGSRFGVVYDNFGFVPVDEDIDVSRHGSSISFEYVLDYDPDYILVIDRAAVTGGSVSAQQMFENELVKATQAYQSDRIIYLNSEIWYVASGGLGGTLEMINDLADNI